ncbi:universal stress protein [Streptomyces sp. NBC_01446]|uniref:Universal stress protein n=1 Tax=Streptomyces sp. NBC_00119 TaxID=2975659 RepID=A0AAU1UKG3_9ACTN|nr:universal stress protein [Streptomyces sp. NBC_01446]MCX4649946.1 universal stress protein [Streptomyces sp. NBC_01446]
MTNTAAGREILVGIDPARDCHMLLAWAADEAHRRRLPLRLLVAVPAQLDSQHVDATTQMMAQRREGTRALEVAASWVRERHADVDVATDVLDGRPAQILIRLSGRARMIVLGSRHLSRTEEFLSAGSLVVPVSAQARCPVVVVGDAEHVTQEPLYLVVGVDGSEPSKAALALAFEEASLRGAALRALWVWQPPVLSLKDEPSLVQTQRSLLSEAVAGWAEKYPNVPLTHEVPVGHPVEELARAAERALAVVVGRRGNGGYLGMRLGSVVHGLLHRAQCPVVTVPVR